MQAQHTWKINSVFYSIAGESSLAGTPMIFIRLAGCNLRCSFCDSKQAWKNGKEMTWSEIHAIISKYPCKKVCLTGGEPYIQHIEHLSNLLQDAEYWISVETNGIIYKPAHAINHIVVSPKTTIHPAFLALATEFKYIIQTKKDIERIASDGFKRAIYLQSVDNDPIATALCVEAIKQNSAWRLSMQLHKIIGIK